MQSSELTSPLGMAIPFALNGDKNFPDETATGTDTSSLNLGFLPITQQPLEDGGIAPERVDFNGMFYLSTDLRVFLQNGGVITYNPDVVSKIGGYPKNAILGYIDNTGRFGFVRSLKEDNAENFVANPNLIDNVNWEWVNLKNFDLLNTRFTTLQNNINTLDSSVVKLANTQTVTGNKTFSGSNNFTGTIKVLASTANGTALQLANRGSYSIKLGDGTIINWGNKSTPSRNTDYTINFGISFTNTNYGLILTPIYSEWGTVTPCVKKKNNASAIIRGDDNRTISWIAIGR